MRTTTAVPTANVRYFGPGEHCTDALPGDIVLVARNGLVPSSIRFGQRLRFRGAQRQWAWANHACVVVAGGLGATVVEQLTHGGQVTSLANYVAEEYAVITLADVDAEKIAAFARKTVGDTYGWPTILAAALYCITGLRLDLGFGDWMICSVATSEAMKVGGILVAPLFGQLPADIAQMTGVPARLN